MRAEDNEIAYKLVKASAKHAVRQGSIKGGLPDEVAGFLATQLAFTFDLVKKGHKLTPAYLAVLLAQKSLGMASLASAHRYDCAITVLLLGTSLTKAIAMTAFTGPVHLLITAAELLSECYSVDKSCGVSDAVYEKIEETALPAYIWMEQGIVQWLSSSGSPLSAR